MVVITHFRLLQHVHSQIRQSYIQMKVNLRKEVLKSTLLKSFQNIVYLRYCVFETCTVRIVLKMWFNFCSTTYDYINTNTCINYWTFFVLHIRITHIFWFIKIIIIFIIVFQSYKAWKYLLHVLYFIIFLFGILKIFAPFTQCCNYYYPSDNIRFHFLCEGNYDVR